MQITLNEEEITTAIEGYVRQHISISPDQRVKLDLKAGRGENGFTATLDITGPLSAFGSVKTSGVTHRDGPAQVLTSGTARSRTPSAVQTIAPRTVSPIQQQPFTPEPQEEPTEPEAPQEVPGEEQPAEEEAMALTSQETQAEEAPTPAPARRPSGIFQFNKAKAEGAE